MVYPKGTLVDIEIVVLKAGDRAPQVPKDTQSTDLIMKVKGKLTKGAKIGDQVSIITPIRRILSGILIEANPSYTHQFGSPINELISIGSELRDLLRSDDREKL